MIKRYYLVKTEHLPHNFPHNLGEYHYLDLADGHHALVLYNQRATPHPEWEPLPHLLDTEKVSSAHAAKLTDLGVTTLHNGFQAARQIAKIHPAFEP
jgi:hypothetical protein